MSAESANAASVAVCIAERGSWDRHQLVRLSLSRIGRDPRQELLANRRGAGSSRSTSRACGGSIGAISTGPWLPTPVPSAAVDPQSQTPRPGTAAGGVPIAVENSGAAPWRRTNARDSSSSNARTSRLRLWLIRR